MLVELFGSHFSAWSISLLSLNVHVCGLACVPEGSYQKFLFRGKNPDIIFMNEIEVKKTFYKVLSCAVIM